MMKRVSWLSVLVAVLALALSAIGVNAQDATEPAGGYSWQNPKGGAKPDGWSTDQTDCSSMKKDGPWTIGVSNASLANSYRVQMISELQAYAAKNPNIKELIITNADGNVAKQITDVNDLLAKGVDAIMIAPASPDGLAPSAEDAYDSGIPTVIFNDRVNTDKFTSIVWADEYKFGYIGGAWLREAMGGKGNIVLLEGIAGMSVSDLRSQGAIDALGPDIKILARQPASWAYDQGKKVMEDFISAYPGQINGVYSQGGAMSLGALEALEAAGQPLVPVPGEGNNGFLKFWAAHLKDGFHSIAPDEPTWESVAALDQVTDCLEGKTIAKWSELELPTITDDTVNQYVRTDCPDDVWSNTKMLPEQITELYKCSGPTATAEATASS
jgi:ribose transport system substrate-binding protein